MIHLSSSKTTSISSWNDLWKVYLEKKIQISIIQMHTNFNLLVLACMGQAAMDKYGIMGISHFD